MTKQIVFEGDAMRVTEPGPVNALGHETFTVHEIAGGQVAAHRVMFYGDMSAAQRTKADAVAAKFARAAEGGEPK